MGKSAWKISDTENRKEKLFFFFYSLVLKFDFPIVLTCRFDNEISYFTMQPPILYEIINSSPRVGRAVEKSERPVLEIDVTTHTIR